MWKAIKLRFNGPLHISHGRDEYDKSESIYHSDSLKAAVYAVGLPYFDNWSDWHKFSQAIRLSSCFPFAGNEWFLPKPHLKKKIIFSGIAEDLMPKKSKKIEFIEKSLFEQFINTNGDWKVDAQLVHPNGKFICKNEQTFTTVEKNKKIYFDFFKSDVQSRVKVPLEGETDNAGKPVQSQPYYVERIYFNHNCGLYFIVQFHDAQIEKEFYKALNILGQHGIGTDRTVGNGFFEFDETVDVCDFQLQVKSNYGLQMPLGLYLPTKEEHAAIDYDNSHWGLIKRGGFIAGSQHQHLRHLWKNEIFMFTEGSIFKASIALNGKYENLQPRLTDDWGKDMHPVWRDGQCLILNF